MARYLTADELINRAAVEVGLNRVSDPFGSLDPVFKQLKELLNSVGDELLAKMDWPQLLKEGSIVTTGAPNRYSVPTDYLKFVERTGWDSLNDQPLGGPLTSQQWSVAVNDSVVSTVNILYREVNDQFWLFPTTLSAGYTLPYEYIRRTWVLENGGSYDDKVEVYNDTVLFDHHIVVKLLKLRFLAARGFNTTEAREEYNQAFDTYAGKTASAPVLSLTGSSGSRLLGADNAPDSGLGI